ncbi:hypothetical protein GF336_00620 [Candidatus Woesearchaeota archaeon]|nr:hypothetical protein [Candidatus Woesearchaeota archaeon]
MSYARLHGKSRFYAFEDYRSGNLEIYPHKDVGTVFLSLNVKQVKQLKNICERYLNDQGNKDFSKCFLFSK